MFSRRATDVFVRSHDTANMQANPEASEAREMCCSRSDGAYHREQLARHLVTRVVVAGHVK